MKALILEPDAIVALDLLNTLKRLGYKDVCYTCYTQDALAKVKEQHPELIVMDVCLQGAMDGIGVGQQIWKRGNIPIVYLVSHIDKDAFRKAEQTMPFSYVVKPFEESKLRAAIKSVVSPQN